MSFVSRWADEVADEIYVLRMRKPEEKESRQLEMEAIRERELAEGLKPGNKYWTIATAGAGLFSDGYVNNSIGTASTILSTLYPVDYAESNAISNVSSIAFVGTVVGQLVFGYVADYHSRKIGMVVSTIILIIFSILASGSWGAHGSINGMFSALTAYRFFLGIGIGGEYPAGSVACAEATAAVGRGSRNRWFVLFTNFMIDFGFVVSAFVPLVLLWICKKDHLTPVWRLTLGLGAIPPMFLLVMRLKFKENDSFRRNNFKRTRMPYWLIFKFYWFRLVVVALIWWIYDFSAYSFGIYSSAILSHIIPDGDIYKTFGWNVVVNLFYLPGSFAGAFVSDYLGPRLTLVIGVLAQGIIGFAMAASYETLTRHIAGFVVVYGFFLTFGEFGPGDNIGLIASKTSATAIRGQYYGIAAATGKIGAFVGTWVFPVIIRRAGGSTTVKGQQAPFYVSSALCIFSAFLALFFLPSLTQESVENEDERFRSYLMQNGFDVSLIGDLDVVQAEQPSYGADNSQADKTGFKVNQDTTSD